MDFLDELVENENQTVNRETMDEGSMDAEAPVPYHTDGGHRKIHQGSEDRAAASQEL